MRRHKRLLFHSEKLKTASCTGEGVGREDGKGLGRAASLHNPSSFSSPLSDLSTSPPRVHRLGEKTKTAELGAPLSIASLRERGEEMEAAAASLER